VARIILILLGLCFFGMAAWGQRAPAFEDVDETRMALEEAQEALQQAQERSARLQQDAADAVNAADQTAREAAALAARVQVAEAGIATAEARINVIAAQRDELREELGREQQPIVHLTAALQQFARRPVTLSLLRPGEIKDVVYLRAVMANTVPEVSERTSGLREQIARYRRLEREAEQAIAVLREEEQGLAGRRSELAAIETRQRLAAREAGNIAGRESERALALAEEARDLDMLVGELDRAAGLRERLAALPGPLMRPGSGGALATAPDTRPSPLATATGPVPAPTPYYLPVTGRIVTGFGAPQGSGLSQGLTLAPRADAQVVAPGAGRVAFAGPYRGYGQIVIIEHAGGWTSLVTGLARSDVEVGERVLAGAPIGAAGPGRPTISLELRKDSEAVNPLEYGG
jgi:septal ring factor EnvC (AmiA/AmiB activator)